MIHKLEIHIHTYILLNYLNLCFSELKLYLNQQIILTKNSLKFLTNVRDIKTLNDNEVCLMILVRKRDEAASAIQVISISKSGLPK